MLGQGIRVHCLCHLLPERPGTFGRGVWGGCVCRGSDGCWSMSGSCGAASSAMRCELGLWNTHTRAAAIRFRTAAIRSCAAAMMRTCAAGSASEDDEAAAERVCSPRAGSTRSGLADQAQFGSLLQTHTSSIPPPNQATDAHTSSIPPSAQRPAPSVSERRIRRTLAAQRGRGLIPFAWGRLTARQSPRACARLTAPRR